MAAQLRCLRRNTTERRPPATVRHALSFRHAWEQANARVWPTDVAGALTFEPFGVGELEGSTHFLGWAAVESGVA
jgi:hypothetical protein